MNLKKIIERLVVSLVVLLLGASCATGPQLVRNNLGQTFRGYDGRPLVQSTVDGQLYLGYFHPRTHQPYLPPGTGPQKAMAPQPQPAPRATAPEVRSRTAPAPVVDYVVKTHVVAKDENLSMIGRKYGCKASEIVQESGLSTTTIHPGQVLKVRERKSTTPPPNAPRTRQPVPTPVPPVQRAQPVPAPAPAPRTTPWPARPAPQQRTPYWQVPRQTWPQG